MVFSQGKESKFTGRIYVFTERIFVICTIGFWAETATHMQK